MMEHDNKNKNKGNQDIDNSFEKILRTYDIPMHDQNLVNRIVQHSHLIPQKQRPFTFFFDKLTDILDDIMLPAPAYSMAALLLFSFIGGASLPNLSDPVIGVATEDQFEASDYSANNIYPFFYDLYEVDESLL